MNVDKIAAIEQSYYWKYKCNGCGQFRYCAAASTNAPVKCFVCSSKNIVIIYSGNLEGDTGFGT